MVNRRTELIQMLLENRNFITTDELARKFGISVRTLRDDLNYAEDFLSQRGVELVRDRNRGIGIERSRLDRQRIKTILYELKKEDRYGDQEREERILHFILLNTERFTLNTLSELVGIGRNTAIRDLARCEKWLNRRNLRLTKKTRVGMSLEGEEYDWRQAILDFMLREPKTLDYQRLYRGLLAGELLTLNAYINDLAERFTAGVHLKVIRNFIRKYETDNRIKFSDESFSRIYFYLCICITRIRQGHVLPKTLRLGDYGYVDTVNVEWLQENRRLLEEGEHICLDDAESLGILLNLACQNKYFTSGHENLAIDDKTLVKDFVERVQGQLGIALENDGELFKSLMIHMRPALNRLRCGMHWENPLREEIKTLYTSIFSACGEAARGIEEKLGVLFNEDETAYLTMHVASAIERNREISDYFHKVLVVCTSGIGTSNMLVTRLMTEFPNISVKGVCAVNDLQNQDRSDVEFIVSTVPLFGDWKEPVIYVSPLLNGDDIEKIAVHLSKGSYDCKKTKEALVNHLMMLIAQECSIENYSRLEGRLRDFFDSKPEKSVGMGKLLSDFAADGGVLLDFAADSWEDAVQAVGEQMVNTGKVEASYTGRLLDSCRERRGGVIVAEGVAMPHAQYEKDVLATAMVFLRLKTPVTFEGEITPVWLVVALAATRDNAHTRSK